LGYSNSELVYQKKILELIDPATWLRANTDFKPWPYEASLLRHSNLTTRVIRKSRQVGITTTIAHEAVWKTFTRPTSVILIVSPSLRQSEIVMTKILAAIDANASLSGQLTRKTNTEIMLTNGSKIICLPNNSDTIRGFTATDVYLDEAAYFPNDELIARVTRPMLAATHGRITITSTPAGKRGLFYKEYMHAANKKADDHLTKAFDYFPSSISPLITEEILQAEQERLTDLEYRQEYLGEFIEEADTYLPMGLIQRCVNKELQLIDEGEPKKAYVIGIDLAKQQDETVAIILEREKDQYTVRHIDAWSRMDYTEQVARIGELGKKFRIIGGAVDQTGVGEAIIEDLKKEIRAVEGVKFTQKTKLDLASGLRWSMEHEILVLPDDQKLIAQLNSLHYKIGNTGELIFESSANHDDYLWALALAVYAARRTPIRIGLPIVRTIDFSDYEH
jgi:phage FluMu gp28-like protein